MAGGMRDKRKKPRIATEAVFQSVLAMMLSRMGSLNALEQTAKSRCWKKLLDVRTATNMVGLPTGGFLHCATREKNHSKDLRSALVGRLGSLETTNVSLLARQNDLKPYIRRGNGRKRRIAACAQWRIPLT